MGGDGFGSWRYGPAMGWVEPKFSGTITIEDDSAVEAGSLRFN